MFFGDMGKTAPGIPSWARTIGGIFDAGGEAQAWCSQCGRSVVIDLPALIAKVGRDYSLVDRRCRCRITPGCMGSNQFRYSSSPDSIRWNLRTEGGMAWRDAREWAARDFMVGSLRKRAEFAAQKKERGRR